MPRESQKPVRQQDADHPGATIETHPAYGAIVSAETRTNGAGETLFAASEPQRKWLTLRLHRAWYERSPYADGVEAIKQPLAVLCIAPEHAANLLMGNGATVPVTFESIGTTQLPSIELEPPPRVDYQERMNKAIDASMTEVDAIIASLEGQKRLSPQMTAVLNNARNARRRLDKTSYRLLDTMESVATDAVKWAKSKIGNTVPENDAHPAARKLPMKPTQGTRLLPAQPVRKKRP